MRASPTQSGRWIAPVVLESSLVRLEPLELRHAPDLARAGAFPTIWRYMPVAPVLTETAMERWVAQSIASGAGGQQIPFAIVLRSSSTAIGSTRYMDVRPNDRGIEIGWSWITPEFQRTGVNTHCKYLLLKHAFEALEAVRVQLKTDGRNLQSQQAIARLGAIREGVLRKHLKLPDGFVRDTVYFSVLAEEWPAVRERLQDFMRAKARSA